MASHYPYKASTKCHPSTYTTNFFSPYLSMEAMNGQRDGNPCCYFHPRELVVGVCALCLKERLLILALKQRQRNNNSSSTSNSTNQRSFRDLAVKSSKAIVIPKVFSLSSLLQLSSNSCQNRSKFNHPDENSIPSLEDSFISMKFEEDGKASWDKKKISIQQPIQAKFHGKERGSNGLKWKKKISQLFQVFSGKKQSNKSRSTHEEVKGRGWMRSLTRKKPTSIA